MANNRYVLFIIVLYVFSLPVLSHGEHNHGGHFNPDSLETVTVQGTAIVDSSDSHPWYYLDSNGDGQADFHLNFGPWWYEPDNGSATRPDDGEFISITGGKHDQTLFDFPTIVVYEINDEFWRDPYNPFWNNLGRHVHDDNHHHGNCTGFAFGWLNDTLRTLSVDGVAVIDTTFIHEQYYLDDDGDGTPEYFLNFGPPWYEPDSGAERPTDGESISIKGGVIADSNFSVIFVYEINGLVWRDSSRIDRHFGGGWMHKNMNEPKRIHDPFDQENWMQVNPAWNRMGRGRHGGMMPDSLFGRFLQLFPQNIPNTDNQHVFAGYEIGLFSGNGQNMMGQNGNCSGNMGFSSDADFQLHYSDIQIDGNNIDENTIQVKYWNEQINNWEYIDDADIDKENNTITFSTTEVSNFLIVTGDQVTSIIEDGIDTRVVDDFTLHQNYPNPFNPSTTIQFTLKHDTDVILNIYNVLGQGIATLLNDVMTAGTHTVDFNAQNLSSGTYFYELKIDDQSKVMRMNLIK